jgi:hypothetical protein
MLQQTGFFHNVFFWLRENADTDDALRLADGCTSHLTDIPGVLRLTVGFPAGTNRGVVDNSYGVALLVEFADAAAHDVYQDHPDHLQFIAECSQSWSRIQVYDSVLAVG